MIKQNNTINAVIFKGDESGYVCTCPDLPIVTKGATIDEVLRNFKEATELHLEGEAINGCTGEPAIVITMKPGTVTGNNQFYPN